MSTTAALQISSTRQRLLGGGFELRTKLSSAYTAGSGVMTFAYPVNTLQPGVRLTIGLSTFYVWAVNSDYLSATVEGGHQGTTDLSYAVGATVLIRPEYSDAEILSALNEELSLLSAGSLGLFATSTVQLTANSAITGYDLAAPGLQRILEVAYREPTSPDPAWHLVNKQYWRLERSASTADFPDGMALSLLASIPTGQPIRVTYSRPFGQYVALTDTSTSVLLPDTAIPILPLGAAITLLAGKEVRRNSMEAQPDPRRASDVPPGSVANSARGLMMRRQELIDAERVRLMQTWPDVLR